jgi:hypothetical protein
MAFRVNNRQCSTCIFNRRSPISPKRFDELKAQWAAEDIVQICHHSSMQGDDVGCRGHYEAARRGDIPHPITGIAETLGLGELPIDQLMGLCESIGWVEFVEVKDDV